MRLLITTDTIGGVWTYTRELVSGLLRRGHQVTLVSFGRVPTRQQTCWMAGLPGLDFLPTGFRLEWMQDSQGDIAASTEFLQSLVETVKPELLHLNQYCYGSLNSDVPRLVVAHSDVVSWSVAVRGSEPEDSSFTRWYRRIVSDGVAGATAVVGITRFMLQNVARYFACPRQSTVIHNGRSPELFDPRRQKEDVVLSAGRLWDEAKQTSLLLRAKVGCPVWIAGEQRHREQGDPGLASKPAECLGVLEEDEIGERLARAAIYAATSRYEPFGLAPVEAAFSACAIVANDIEPFHELWGDNVSYFPRNDVHGLGAVIAKLRADQSLRLEMSQRARECALNRFIAERMVDEYIALYARLINQRSEATITAGAA
jgi:glycogen(starch) synthase